MNENYQDKDASTRLFQPVSSHSLRRGDKAAYFVSLMCGLLIVGLLVYIFYELLKLSMPAIKAFGFRFLITNDWDPVSENFGVLPFLYGTIVSSAIALIIATPFGIGTALFLTELATAKVRSIVGFIVDMLAAIPSVVYGLWGIFVLAPFIQTTMAPFLQKYLGFLPLFQGRCDGLSMLAAGIILAIMVVPFITAISREVLSTVPSDLKAASLALGATPWETIWKVVLPYARAGIGGGVVLALGRALGETMAVTMIIGNSPNISLSILRPGHTMSAVIANEFSEADSSLYLPALVEIGLLLFLVALIINLGARLLLWRISRATS